MSKSTYAVINGKNRKVKKKFAVINGVNRKIKKTFVVVDGKYRECWSGAYPAGQQVFTTSGSWVAPFTGTIDVFMVNGGNSGDAANATIVMQQGDDGAWFGGRGGDGGNTKTISNISVIKGQSYPVVIGAGARVSGGEALGGTTSFNSEAPKKQYYKYYYGCGSGGGAGEQVTYNTYNRTSASNGSSNGDNGQGTTTRAFAESTGSLYSGGGGGGGCYLGWGSAGTGGAGGGGNGSSSGTGSSGTPNMGGGGGGGAYTSTSRYGGGDGGSGVVIIRWSEQEE